MLKYISDECMLMEVDWGGNLKLNYTSCGVKLILNFMVDRELMELTQMDTTSMDFTQEAMVPVPTI